MSLEQDFKQLEQILLEKAEQDPAFRELIKTDFEQAIFQATGISVSFQALEAERSRLAAAAQEAGELTEAGLEAVAGGVTTTISGTGVPITGSLGSATPIASGSGNLSSVQAQLNALNNKGNSGQQAGAASAALNAQMSALTQLLGSFMSSQQSVYSQITRK